MTATTTSSTSPKTSIKSKLVTWLRPRHLLRWFGRGVILLVVVGLTILNCIDFSMEQDEVDSYFRSRNVAVSYHTYRHGSRDLFYAATGTPGKPLIAFVHGSPGSWDAFIAFLAREDLGTRARLISIDRPGFGRSGPGVAEPSMRNQAADLLPALVQEAAGQPVILVGHSLGAPVIARIAMDYPELVSGLILVGASIDPDLEETKWFQIPANWKALSWLVPRDLKMSNREILPLAGELRQMVPLWSNIKIPVSLIHGEKDRLVPVANVDFALRMLTQAKVDVVRMPEVDHFIPWTDPGLILAAIDRHLERLTPVATLEKGP